MVHGRASLDARTLQATLLAARARERRAAEMLRQHGGHEAAATLRAAAYAARLAAARLRARQASDWARLI